MNNSRREDMILLNGHENFTSRLGLTSNITVDNYDTEALLDLHDRAKVVVAFCTRGTERTPVEAVLGGESSVGTVETVK